MPSFPSMSCSRAECRYRRTPQTICHGWRTWDGNRCRSHWLKTEKQGGWNKTCTGRSLKKKSIRYPQNLENTVRGIPVLAAALLCGPKDNETPIELVCRRPAARARGSNYLFAWIFSYWAFCLCQVLLFRLGQRDAGNKHKSPHQEKKSLSHCQQHVLSCCWELNSKCHRSQNRIFKQQGLKGNLKPCRDLQGHLRRLHIYIFMFLKKITKKS